MENPYAPPVLVTDAADLSNAKPENYLEISWASAVSRGFVASACAGGLVLMYQIIRYTFSFPRPYVEVRPAILMEAASFASALPFLMLVFLLPFRNLDARKIGLTLLCSLLGFLGVLVWLYLLYKGQASGWLVLGLLPGSQIATVMLACWLHQVAIRPLRLIIGAVLGIAVWIGLTFTAILLIVKPMSYPFDDYAGFTLLTMFWCWSVALQMPLMLNKTISAANRTVVIDPGSV